MALQHDPSQLFSPSTFFLASMVYVLISLPSLLVLPSLFSSHGPLPITELPFSAHPTPKKGTFMKTLNR